MPQPTTPMSQAGGPPAEADDDLKMWNGRIELAKVHQRKHGNTDGRWDRNVKALAGDFNSLSELGEEAIDVNLVRSTQKAVLPPLWVTEPHISVRPTTARFKDADNVRMAEVTELEINYWLRELEVRNEVKKIVVDAEATNLGYLYVGYVSDRREVETEDGMRTEPIPWIRPNRPFVKRISPKNVLIPWGYDELEACPWISIVFYQPLKQVRERFGDGRTEDLPTLSLRDKLQSDTSEFEDFLDSEDAKFVELHNVWDKHTGKVYVLVPGHDRFLDDPKDWPFDVEGFPLEQYRPEYVSDEYHGTPPTSYYLPQNKEINATRTAMRKRRNRTKAVVWMDADIAKDAQEKYKSAPDGAIIPIDLGGEDIRAKMTVDPGLPFDQGDLIYDGVIKGDIREQSGLGAERRGAGDPNVDTATASANIEKGIQIREADRGDGIKRVYLGVGKKLWMILKQHPDQERSRLIAGPLAGQFTEVTYTLKELRGEFNFDMDFGAALADNPQARATQAILKYNLMRADPLVNPEKLILDVLATQNTPDPTSYLLALRQPQQELERMLAGLPVEAHERDPHEQHLQAHDQQAQSLNAQLEQMPDSTDRRKLALAQMLLVAHVQDHARMLQQITGQQQGRQAGQPVAENLLRNQVRAGSGETQAELSGQPITNADLVQ